MRKRSFVNLKFFLMSYFSIFFFSAIVEKYLLEKSRIVSQAKNERYAQTSTTHRVICFAVNNLLGRTKVSIWWLFISPKCPLIDFVVIWLWMVQESFTSVMKFLQSFCTETSVEESLTPFVKWPYSPLGVSPQARVIYRVTKGNALFK